MSTASHVTSRAASGLEYLQTGPNTYRIVHSGSGLHVPMVTWPTDDLPFAAAVIAMNTLAGSGIDWTQTRDQLRSDRQKLAGAVKAAALTARQARTGDQAR